MVRSIQHSLAPIRQTAAQLLAAAVCDIFPGTRLAGGLGTDRYFYYDFHFPFPFEPDILPLIEERMRTILREERPIVCMEMMPMNAADLMMHQKQPLVAARLRRFGGTTAQMCKIGVMADFCPEEFSTESNLGFFKLIEGIDLQDPDKKHVRIVGALAEDKAELKGIVKQGLPSKKGHMTRVSSMKLLQPLDEMGAWAWLPKGLMLREAFCAIWNRECVKKNVTLVSTPYSFLPLEDPIAVRGYFESLASAGLSRAAELLWSSNEAEEGEGEGLFSTHVSYSDRGYLICAPEKLLEETISFLQFILKIPKILGFEFEIVLSVSCAGNQGKRKKASTLLEQALKTSGLEYTVCKVYSKGEHARIELLIPDALGRKWPGPFMSYPELARDATCGEVLVFSAFGSLERLIALLLENQERAVPFEELLEQVRQLEPRMQ